MMKKLLFVYNPHSGKGKMKHDLSDVISVFTAGGFEVTVHPTCASLDGQQYIAQNGSRYDLIVCSGGDGMLHELVCAMTENNIQKPCGYIPSGTINDFASSLKIPKNAVEAAKMIMEEKYKNIDVGCFNGQYFAYVAAFGMFTDVSYITDQKKKNIYGSMAYLHELMKRVDVWNFINSSVHAIIQFGNESIEDDFIYGMAGNTFSVAGIKNLVPTGVEMNDGLIDGMFIRTPKTIAEAEQIKKALVTQKYDIPNIICAKENKFTIISETNISWTLDGEFGGKYNKTDISVEKEVLKIAVPD